MNDRGEKSNTMMAQAGHLFILLRPAFAQQAERGRLIFDVWLTPQQQQCLTHRLGSFLFKLYSASFLERKINT